MLIVKSITSCSTIRAIFGGTDGVFFYFILVLYILNGGVFNKRVIPLALVAYEMITASQLDYLISNKRSWNIVNYLCLIQVHKHSPRVLKV